MAMTEVPTFILQKRLFSTFFGLQGNFWSSRMEAKLCGAAVEKREVKINGSEPKPRGK
jgi:hypothetical protein